MCIRITLHKIIEIPVNRNIQFVPIIKSGSFYHLIVNAKSHRLDKMKSCIGRHTCTSYIARIGRHFRLQ